MLEEILKILIEFRELSFGKKKEAALAVADAAKQIEFGLKHREHHPSQEV